MIPNTVNQVKLVNQITGLENKVVVTLSGVVSNIVPLNKSSPVIGNSYLHNGFKGIGKGKKASVKRIGIGGSKLADSIAKRGGTNNPQT